MKLKDMKISKKLVLSFVGVAIIIVIVEAAGLYGVGSLAAAMSNSQERMNSLPVISNVISSISSIQIESCNATIDADTNYQDSKVVDADRKTFEKYEQLYKTNSDKLLSTVDSDEWKTKLQEAMTLYNKDFEPKMKQVFDLAQQGRITQANKILKGVLPVGEKISNIYSGYMDYHVKVSDQNNSTNNQMSVALFAVLILVSTAGIAASMAFGIMIAKSISRPIDQLVDASKEFEKGSLSTEIKYASKNEIGVLAGSLNTTFRTLQNTVREISSLLFEISKGRYDIKPVDPYGGDFIPISDAINTILSNMNRIFTSVHCSSAQIDSGAKQVADSAQDLAKGVSKQAGTVQELSDSINDVSAKVQQNAANISEMASDMDTATGEVTNSNEKMQQLLEAMNQIANFSEKISKIIKVIDNIAFQTNILALNAAVEAARAGESGKGFAVVAEEVRNLAVKSAEAAKQTASLIENSDVNVKNGLALAGEAAEALAGINSKITKINDTIQQIENVSKEQSKAVHSITQGIEQISEVIQTDSATAEQSSAASGELFTQVNMLNRELVFIKLREGENP